MCIVNDDIEQHFSKGANYYFIFIFLFIYIFIYYIKKNSQIYHSKKSVAPNFNLPYTLYSSTIKNFIVKTRLVPAFWYNYTLITYIHDYV